MKLRGIEFGPVLGASETSGFFDNTLRQRTVLRGVTFVAKTATLLPHDEGPDRAIVKFGAGVVLRSAHFSNPGLKALLDTGRWQKIDTPFFLSFASLAPTREARTDELRKMATTLLASLPDFHAPVGMEICFPCSNSEDDQIELASEVRDALGALSVLNIPLVPKLSVHMPPDQAADILGDPNCDAISVSSPIAWDDIPERAQKVFFRTNVSPLARQGGGVVSGKYLLPLTAEWVRQLKRQPGRKPVIADGGILRPNDVDRLIEAGASAVSLESAVMLRPWNVRRISTRAERLLLKK